MSWNLPPGCTDRDIDIAAGDYPVECPACCDSVQACDLGEHGLCENCEAEAKCRKETKEEREERLADEAEEAAKDARMNSAREGNAI